MRSNIIQLLPLLKAGSATSRQTLADVYLMSHDKASPERLWNLVPCLNALVPSELFSYLLKYTVLQSRPMDVYMYSRFGMGCSR